MTVKALTIGRERKKEGGGWLETLLLLNTTEDRLDETETKESPYLRTSLQRLPLEHFLRDEQSNSLDLGFSDN